MYRYLFAELQHVGLEEGLHFIHGVQLKDGLHYLRWRSYSRSQATSVPVR